MAATYIEFKEQNEQALTAYLALASPKPDTPYLAKFTDDTPGGKSVGLS